MKIKYTLLLIGFAFGCQQQKFDLEDLPSKNLIDSVILTAWQGDSTRLPIWKLNSELTDWELPVSIRNDELTLHERIKYFPFDYVKGRLLEQNRIDAFDYSDSLFLVFQIRQEYRDTLSLNNKLVFGYTNTEEIERKKGAGIQFSYIQYSKPLFNKSKTICVVGESSYSMDSKLVGFEGGVLIVLKRQGKEWFVDKYIDWWGH